MVLETAGDKLLHGTPTCRSAECCVGAYLFLNSYLKKRTSMSGDVACFAFYIYSGCNVFARQGLFEL